MISKEDREQRRYADAFATGCPIDRHVSPATDKAEAYGRLRPHLGSNVIGALRQSLRTFNGKSIDDLTRAGMHGLADYLYPAMRQAPDRERLTHLFNVLNMRRGREPSEAAVLGRLDSGIGTGMLAEGIVLRTLRRHTLAAGTLSRAALYASSRVSVSLATQYSAIPGGASDHGLTEFPEPPIAEDELGSVLKPSTYTIDPERGLDLTVEPVCYSSDADDPHLGCPFRAIKELHAVLADVAVNQGIIQLTD